MKLQEVNNYKPPFSKQQIQAVAEFQNYGGSIPSVGKKLFSLNWPDEILKCNSTLYRVVVLPRKTVDSILSGISYPSMKVSSWSKSMQISKEFIHSHWFTGFYHDLDDKNMKPTILLLGKIITDNIVDIDRLHKNPDFKKSIGYYENEGIIFNEGLDFGDSQREVAVKSFSLQKSDIMSVISYGEKNWINI